jgi:cytochrome c-type biogenesis protein CcmH/NrfF
MARKLEDDILEAALRGQNREEIEASLVARFGREKMGYEQSTSVFVIVTLLALAAVVLIVRAGRRWSAKGAQASNAEQAGGDAKPSISQDELDDLEDDLDALDGI